MYHNPFQIAAILQAVAFSFAILVMVSQITPDFLISSFDLGRLVANCSPARLCYPVSLVQGGRPVLRPGTCLATDEFNERARCQPLDRDGLDARG